MHDLLAAGARSPVSALALIVQTYTTYAKAPKKPAGATATPKPTKTSSKAKRAAMETQVVRRAGAL